MRKKRMNYEVVFNDIDALGKFSVIENQTGQIIDSFSKVDNAREIAKKLNNGLGFDGWTPNFFLKSVANLSHNTK